MAVLIDSYSESEYNLNINLGDGTDEGVAQSFEVESGEGGDLSREIFYLRKVGSPTGSIYAKLYSHTGTFGTSSEPDSLLATSNAVDVSGISDSAHELVEFTFSGAQQYTMAASTYYCITVEYTGGDADNKVWVGVDFSSATHAGNYAIWKVSPGEWQAYSGADTVFYVYHVGEYNQTTTGVFASSGSILKDTDKFPVGAFVSTGVLQRSIAKFPTGIFVATGLVRKSITKTITGIITFTGSMLKGIGKNIIGIFTSSGILQKGIGKFPTGIFTSSGAIKKAITKTVTGALTLAGRVFKTGQYVLVEGIFRPSGRVIRGFFITLSGIFRPRGYVRKTNYWNRITDLVTSWTASVKSTLSWNLISKTTTDWTEDEKPTTDWEEE